MCVCVLRVGGVIIIERHAQAVKKRGGGGSGGAGRCILWDVCVVRWGEGALWSGLGLFLCAATPPHPSTRASTAHPGVHRLTEI